MRKLLNKVLKQLFRTHVHYDRVGYNGCPCCGNQFLPSIFKLVKSGFDKDQRIHRKTFVHSISINGPPFNRALHEELVEQARVQGKFKFIQTFNGSYWKRRYQKFLKYEKKVIYEAVNIVKERNEKSV